MNVLTPAPPQPDTTWTPPAFVPRRGLGNGHLMTVFAWASRRRFDALPAP